MNTHANKTSENKSQAVVNSLPKLQSNGENTFQFVDNRPEAIAQREMHELKNDSPQVLKLRSLQEMAKNSPQAKQAAQLQAMLSLNPEEELLRGGFESVQLQGDELNSNPLENKAGVSLDHVKVHYNSAQQAQGRVRPTVQSKDGVPVSDDARLEHEAELIGERAATGGLQSGGQKARPAAIVPLVQAKNKEEIARHGSFDVIGAKYRLLEGEGCEISIRFKLGTGIPAGTKISFIQAIRTIMKHSDESVTTAQKVDAQEPAEGFERIDQFKGNPSAYYLDYIDEKLVELINLESLDENKRGYDIRDYEEYKKYSMDAVAKNVFDNFWDKFDNKRLVDLITVQTETSSKTDKMAQGKKLDAASLKNFFNLLSSDIDAQIYDMPKDNLRVPTAIGDISTCLFHTAAVTKVVGGDATVWDIVQWGYEITMVGDKAYTWSLIPLKPVAFDSAMLDTALARMKATTTGYLGPNRLVQPG